MGFRSALDHRGFRRLWLSAAISRLGDSVHEIALIWIVYEVTGDPSLLGLVVAASAIPTALSSLPAGSLVDALDRKRVLVAGSLLRGVAVLAIPLTGRGSLLVPVVLAVAVVTGLVEAFAGPARGATIPNLVPSSDLDAANALFDLTRSASRMLYVVGGLAVAAFGSFAVFYLDAVSFLAAAALLAGLPSSAAGPRGRSARERSLIARTVEDVRSGVAYVRGHRLLPSVVLLSALTTLAMAPLAVVLPFFVRETAGGGSVAFGLLYGGIYLGVLVGAVTIGAFDRLTAAYRGPLIVGGVALVGVSLVATATLPGRSRAPLAVAAVTLLAFGAAFTLVNTPIQSLTQATVPDERRGIVFAVMATVAVPALPLGALVAGPLVELLGARTVLLVQGIGLIAVSVPLAHTPLVAAGCASAAPEGMA